MTTRRSPRRPPGARAVGALVATCALLCADHAAAGAGERGASAGATSVRPPAVVVDSEAVLQPSSSMRSFAGAAVAISGDLALVGVPGVAGGASGTVYAFHRLGRAWVSTFDQAIPNPNTVGGTMDNFGASIAISGNFAVIGAPGNTTGAIPGAAYLFEYDASAPLASRWSRVMATLPRPAGGPNRFGASVAISTRWIVVGAPGSGSTTLGAAYVYEMPFTSTATALAIPAATPDDLVGASVAVDGDAILVGAPGYDAPVTDAGAVFAYDYVGGSWGTATTFATDASTRADFGWSVALSNGGTRALVGSPYDSMRASNAGAVWLYDRAAGSGWPGAGRRITATDASAGDYFGFAVALDGDDAVIGARLDDEVGAPMADDTGSAYLLRGAMLDEVARFRATARTPRDHLGSSVALDGDTVLAGAPDSLSMGMVGYVASFRMPQSNGTECGVAGDCESGVCFNLGATGVCCESECAGECEGCSAAGLCVADNEAGDCTGACGAGTCMAGLCATAGCDAGPPDAGPMDAGPFDAGPFDGGPPDVGPADSGPRQRIRISGCRCGVGPAATSPGTLGVMLGLALAVATRRARRR